MRRFTDFSFVAWLMMTQPILHNIKIMGMASELDALFEAIQIGYGIFLFVQRSHA